MPKYDPNAKGSEGLDRTQRLEKHAADSPTLSPAASTDNVVQPSADGVVAFVVKRPSSVSTADLIQFQDETGARLGGVDYTGATSGSQTAFLYRMESDGTTVTARDKNGLVVSSGVDGGAVMQAVLSVIPAGGGNIGFRNDGNVFPWASVPALPRNLTGWLKINGNGVTVKLSTAGPRAFDMPYAADYDTWRYLRIEGLTVDCNNVIAAAADQHVLLGNFVNSTWTQRQNFHDIVVRDCHTVNVPCGTAPQGRQNVSIASRHLASGETQTNITDILIEDCTFAGGNVGVAIFGTGGATGTGANVWHDRIHLTRVTHDCGRTPAGLGTADANVEIVGTGYGGSVRMTDCYGANSADVGFEINACQDFVGRGCVQVDAWTGKYFSRNFRAPLNLAGQRHSWIDCYAKTVNLDRGAATASPDFSIVGDSSTAGWVFGELVVKNCQSDTETALADPNFIGGVILAHACQYRKLTVDGLRVAIPNIVQTNVGHANAPVLCSVESTLALAAYEIRNVSFSVAGSRAGTTGGTWSFFQFGGNSAGTAFIDVDGVTFDGAGLVFTNNDRFRIVEIGNTSRYPNSAGRVRVRRVVSRNTPTVGLWDPVEFASDFTIQGKATIEECDTGFLPSGGGVDYRFLGSATQKAAATIGKIVSARTAGSGSGPVQLPTAITPGASPYDYRNLDSVVEDVIVQGGTVSLLEWSGDGSTYIDIGIIAGVKRLASGDHLRVTYTVAPTMTKAPV